MEALGINLGYLLVFGLSFGILFVVLRAWVFTPLLGQMEKRRLAIARGLEDAREAAEARANAEKEANRIQAEAQLRAAEVIREATQRAEKIEQEVRANLQNEIDQARERAAAELEGDRNRMLSELRGQVVSLSLAAAQKIIAENLDDRRNHILVDEFFSGIRNGKVVFGENIVPVNGAFVDGRPVEITSALPLMENEKDCIQQAIVQQLHSQAVFRFVVDPAILGGLVVRVGDKVVDGSVSGQLEEMRQNLR